MEMFLQKASESDVANKIKADKNWLNEERLDYIVAERPHIFHYLKPEDIVQESFRTSLQNNDALLKFASVAKNNEDWKKFVSQSIKRPLTANIFNNYGLLLNFLEENEYEELAKDWLKEVNANDYIPKEVEKFLDEKQILCLLKDRASLNFENISEDVKTKEVCLAYMERQSSYLRGKIYKSFPIEIQDDADIARLSCAGNKQFYHELTPKAKLHENVIRYVIDSYIGPAGDHDTSHTDETAIKIKELSIEAILAINTVYTISDVLKNNSKLLSNEQIKEKWLSKEEYQEQLLEYYDYFTQENKENFNIKLKNLDQGQKASKLLTVPKLRDLIIDESNVKECLEILFATHLCSNFSHALKTTGLKDIFDKNLVQYGQQYNEISDSYRKKTNIIDISDWLIRENNKEYKQIAFELLSIVLKKDPNALDVDFEYHYRMESRALKKVAAEVYQYMDSQESSKTTKKKM